jgi:predicted ATPase
LAFLLVPIGLASPQDTMMICEPEAHLHPKAQFELADLFLRVWKQDGRQFVIETHSDHILHRFLQAVAAKELALDELAIWYFENKDGQAVVRKVDVDAKGRVSGGLPGFYEQSLAELDLYIGALSRSDS